MPEMRLILTLAAVLGLAACDNDRARAPAPQATAPPAPPHIEASTFPEGRAIDQAEFVAKPGDDANPAARTSPSTMTPQEKSLSVNRQAPVDLSDEALQRRVLIKAQVLLDRAHFGPGVIDGREGGNFKLALRAFEKANGFTEDGELDAQVWRMLVRDDRPIMRDYVITQADVKGPFADRIPDDYRAMSKMERLSYTSPGELLAEKFHMDQDLLERLNPDADFSKAGTKILVAAPVASPLPPVERVEIDKAASQLRAYGANGEMVAVYPATVGSKEAPSPTGTWEVLAVAHDPTWNYDPAKLDFGDKSLGKLTIPAGPNNPVGVVWIDLSKDTYGIHGSPEPAQIGKEASHGCVRLTNWNAKTLAEAISKGAKVAFVGGSSSASAGSRAQRGS